MKKSETPWSYKSLNSEKTLIFFRENIVFLDQLVKSLEEAELSLEEAYDKKDYENFNKSKKFIFQIQKKISEILK